MDILRYNFLNQILDVKNNNSILGVVIISDYIRIEWQVKEGPEGANAFDRCDGFKVEKDDIYLRAKNSQEKDAASVDPLHLFNSTAQKSPTSVLKGEQKLKLEGAQTSTEDTIKNPDDAYRVTLAEFTLKENSLLKKVYNYFAPRVIMKQFHDHYKAVKKLGKGSFASVYLVNHRETGKQLAIKAFLKEKLYLEDKGAVIQNKENKILNDIIKNDSLINIQ